MGTYLSTPRTDKSCESGECIGTVVVIDDEDERHWTDQQQGHVQHPLDKEMLVVQLSDETYDEDNNNEKNDDDGVIISSAGMKNGQDNTNIAQQQQQDQRQTKQQKTSHNYPKTISHYRHYNQNVRWGVVDMQGWRKSMEDAHIAITNVPVPVDVTYVSQQSEENFSSTTKSDNEKDNTIVEEMGFEATTMLATTRQKQINAHIFGVFDGHGGAEVARFCSLFLVSVLQQQTSWRVRRTVTETKSPRSPSSASFSPTVSSPVSPNTTSSFFNDTDKNVNSDKENYDNTASIGDALIDAFHALDRMIDDPKRRDEFVQLRLKKPRPGEQRIAMEIPPPLLQFMNNNNSNVTITNAVIGMTAPSELVAAPTTISSTSKVAVVSVATPTSGTAATIDSNTTDEKNPETTPTTVMKDVDDNTKMDSKAVDDSKDTSKTSTDDDEDIFEDADSQEAVGTGIDASTSKQGDETVESWELDNTQPGGSGNDDDDNVDDNNLDEFIDPIDVMVTTESNPNESVTATLTTSTSTTLSPSGSEGDSGDDEGESDSTKATLQAQDQQQQQSTAVKVSAMLQRLLSLSGQSGQVVLSQSGGAISSETHQQSKPVAEEAAATKGNSNTGAATTPPVEIQPQSQTRSLSSPTLCSVSNQPSIVRNGNVVCNLQEHPVHAGATAIVAVLVDRTLVVANAGDSRAVLCRVSNNPNSNDNTTTPTSVQAIALSIDHKPFQIREITRIHNAGGFVNSFGRVNGNLNLSRSIGDLKYKQVAGIPPERQIITAEPDIKQIQLTDDDEFVILGCDGIWDCLTNEKAVEFVRERIDAKPLTAIGIEMLDSIISVNPQTTQGIGGDNMTILIVDLQPQKRTNVPTTNSIASATTTAPTRVNNSSSTGSTTNTTTTATIIPQSDDTTSASTTELQ